VVLVLLPPVLIIQLWLQLLKPLLALNQDRAQSIILALKVHLVRNWDQPLGQAMSLAPRPRLARNQAQVQTRTLVAPKVHLARNRDQRLVQPALVMDRALKLALALNRAQVQSLTLVGPKVHLAHNPLARNQDQVPVMDLDLRPQSLTLALKVRVARNQD